MAFARPQPSEKLTKAGRQEMLTAYFKAYEELAETDPTALNRKLPREAFALLLDRIGSLVLEFASSPDDSVREFLEANPVPEALQGRLPEDFRAFCLALNALKQWVAAEQAATDRYLLGGQARKECRAVADHCLVTRTPLDGKAELHHPVRDGRPPIPLSKAGHDRIEGQTSGTAADDDGVRANLLAIKRNGNRSWVQLRRGCLELLNLKVEHPTEAVRNTSCTFARKAAEATGLRYRELLTWLDANELGVE